MLVNFVTCFLDRFLDMNKILYTLFFYSFLDYRAGKPNIQLVNTLVQQALSGSVSPSSIIRDVWESVDAEVFTSITPLALESWTERIYAKPAQDTEMSK